MRRRDTPITFYTTLGTQSSLRALLGLALLLLATLWHGRLLLRLHRLRNHLLLLRLLRLRTLLGLLVTLLLDQLKRGTDHGLGRGLGDLPLGLLLGVFESALLVHPAVQKRPRDLPGVELLVEVRL